MIKPSTLGDVVTYTLFSLGGVFLGGELGMLTGSASARRAISSDTESRRRIEHAFRAFRADVLKQEAKELEGGEGPLGF